MNSRPGFALLATLWLIVMLSTACAALTLAGRTFRLNVTYARDEIAGRRAAEAGVAAALATLTDALSRSTTDDAIPIVDPWHHILGESNWIGIGAGAEYRVDLIDPNRRVNLNVAHAADLARLLAAVQVAPDSAMMLALRIVDWRDEDELDAAGLPELEAVGAEFLRRPADQAFSSTGQLAHVAGATGALVERLQDQTTVLGDGRINLQTASAAVLSSLPGMTPDAVVALLRLRAEGSRLSSGIFDLVQHLDPRDADVLDAHLAELGGRTTTETRAIEAIVQGRALGSPLAVTHRVLFERVSDRARITWMRVE